MHTLLLGHPVVLGPACSIQSSDFLSFTLCSLCDPGPGSGSSEQSG